MVIALIEDWDAAECISNIPEVHELLQGFSEDPTGDNGTMVVREVMRALAKQAEAAPAVAASRHDFCVWYNSLPEQKLTQAIQAGYSDVAWLAWSTAPGSDGGASTACASN